MLSTRFSMNSAFSDTPAAARMTGLGLGKANGAYRHGLYTAEAIEERRVLRELLRESKDMLAILPREGKL